MELTVDSGGRIVLPKVLRDAYGLLPGTTVDVSAYGTGLQITPGGRTARIARERGGRLVAQGTTPVTDEIVSALIDAGRR